MYNLCVFGIITEWSPDERLMGFRVKMAKKGLPESVFAVSRQAVAAETYRALVEHSVEGLVILQDGRVVFANAAMASISGYAVDELLALSPQQLADLVHPEDREWVLARLQDRLAGRPVATRYPFRFVRRDGEIRWVEISASVIHYQGRPAIRAAYVDVTDRIRAEQALQRRQQQLVLLSQLGRALAETLELPRIYRVAYEYLSQMVDCASAFGISLYDADTRTLRAEYMLSDGEPIDVGRLPPLQIPLEPARGRARAIATGEPEVTRNLAAATAAAKEAVVISGPDGQVSQSALYMPMVVEGRVIGLVELQSYRPDAYGEEEIGLLGPAAHQIGLAIVNARLYEEARRRARQQATLSRIAQALNTLDVRQAFPVLAEGLQDLTGCERVSLVVPTESDERFRVLTLSPSALTLEEGAVLPLSATAAAEDILAGCPHFTPDLEAEAGFLGEQALYQAGFRSRINLPLQVVGRPVGALNLASRQPGPFWEGHLEVLRQVADALAVALENSRLFQAEREQRALAEALAQAAAAVGSTLELDEVLDRILEQVERVVPGDAFNIALVEDGGVRVVRRRGYERLGVATATADRVLALDEFPALARMVQSGEAFLIADTAGDPSWVPLGEEEWRRSYVGAPIRLKGVTVGFLQVNGTRPGQFGLQDAWRLKAFADQIATAVENARLYQRLQDYAEELEARVEQRTAELADQYARLETILDSTVDGVVVADVEGHVLQANRVAHDWLEHALTPEDAERLRQAIRDVSAHADERPEVLLELTGLDLQVAAAPAVRSQGEWVAVVAIHDVSHLRALERMRSRFISNISHELRTPIATAKLYAALARQRPARWPEYLQALAEEVDRLAMLVDDILQVSRIDAGRVVLSLQTVSLERLTEEEVNRHRTLATEKGLTVEYRPAGPEALVTMDPDQMRQVVDNLLTNSIRCTMSGGRVVISTGRAEADGRHWATLSVADTGIGIPEKELPHIFERFFRGERVREMQIPGTGLGLAIVKEVVELHGGRVTVQSKVGEGTTFTVWLPLAD